MISLAIQKWQINKLIVPCYEFVDLQFFEYVQIFEYIYFFFLKANICQIFCSGTSRRNVRFKIYIYIQRFAHNVQDFSQNIPDQQAHNAALGACTVDPPIFV